MTKKEQAEEVCQALGKRTWRWWECGKPSPYVITLQNDTYTMEYGGSNCFCTQAWARNAVSCYEPPYPPTSWRRERS